MSFTERDARIERAYGALSELEKRIVDNWWDNESDDRKALWTTISANARRVIYMLTDGKPGVV